MNDTREQTNANETADPSAQTSEQSNSKRTRVFLKNGDTGDDQENTTNNNNDEDANKRSRRHERRRENDEEEKDKEDIEEPPQPIIQSSVVRAEPKGREQAKHHGKLTLKIFLYIDILLFSSK